MATIDKELNVIRQKIDDIDQQIQDLISQRAECALSVAKIKQSGKTTPVIYRPEREAQVLRKIMERNKSPLSSQAMADIFLLVMAKCRALQQPLKIAFLGPNKSFSHQAAIRHFGKAILTNTFNSIHKIFHSIATEKQNYGIVPIENSLTGVFADTLDALVEFPLQICGEIVLATPNKKSKNLDNTTRFLIIGRDKAAPSGKDKTTLFISIANKPGSLAKIFQPFANNNVNITFFEPRPYRNKIWNYLFFLDIEGHQQDQNVQKALTELATGPLTYTLLGSYPRALE